MVKSVIYVDMATTGGIKDPGLLTGVVKNENIHGYPMTALTYNKLTGMTT